jgi:hypothetical protein
VEHRPNPAAYLIQVRLRQSEPLGAVRQPLQVLRQRERTSTHRLDRLEDPVPDRQPVVAHRHRGRRGVLEQPAVDPRAHGCILPSPRWHRTSVVEVRGRPRPSLETTAACAETRRARQVCLPGTIG